MPRRYDDDEDIIASDGPLEREPSESYSSKVTWKWIMAVGCCLGVIAIFTVVMVVVIESGNPPSPVFNNAASLRYLYYSYAAYKQPEVGSWSCSYCIGDTNGFHVTQNCRGVTNDTFAYVGYHVGQREVIVAFRGAADPVDWIESLLQPIRLPPYYDFPGVTNAFVAPDFYLLYDELKQCIVDGVKELQSSRYHITVVGHGLGGALASLSAMDMKVNIFHDDIRVYTFGQPRVGNKAWSDGVYSAFGTNFQRMVNYDDCVAKLPKHDLGFVHSPFEIFESPAGDSNYRVCDTSGEDPKCALSKEFDCTAHFTYMGVQCCGRP